MASKTLEDTVKKWGLKEEIKTSTFLAFVLGLIGLMISMDLIDWFNFDDSGFVVFLWLVIGVIVIILGWDKGSLVKFGKAIVEVMYNPRMSPESKLVFIKEQIEKLIGVAEILTMNAEHTGLTNMLSAKETKENKAVAIEMAKDVPKPDPLPAPKPIVLPAVASPPATK